MGNKSHVYQDYLVGDDEPAFNMVQEVALPYDAGVSRVFVQFGDRLIRLLGMAGSKLFSGVHDKSDFIPVIREGLPKQALDSFQDNTGLSLQEVADILRTSDRTLRRYTAVQKLSPDQTERLIEVAGVYSRGAEVFGSLDTFKEWMDRPILAFGHHKPKDYLDTSIGIELILNELGRIEQGIYA